MVLWIGRQDDFVTSKHIKNVFFQVHQWKLEKVPQTLSGEAARLTHVGIRCQGADSGITTSDDVGSRCCYSFG